MTKVKRQKEVHHKSRSEQREKEKESVFSKRKKKRKDRMAQRVRDERGGRCEVGGGGDGRRGASTAAEIQPKIN